MSKVESKSVSASPFEGRKLSAKELRGLPSITTAQFEQLVEVVRTLLTFLGVISDA